MHSALEENIASRILERYASGPTLVMRRAFIESVGWRESLLKGANALEIGRGRLMLQLRSRDYLAAEPGSLEDARDGVELDVLATAGAAVGCELIGAVPYGTMEHDGVLPARGALVGDATWSRLLSWARVAERLASFIDLWQETLEKLSTRSAAHYIAVFEKRAVLDALAVVEFWRARTAALEIPDAQAREKLRGRLQEALRYRPNRVVLFRLLTAAGVCGIDLAKWRLLAQSPQLDDWLERWAIDAAAMKTLESLSDDPEIGALLKTCGGYGPHLEWEFLPLLLDDARRNLNP